MKRIIAFFLAMAVVLSLSCAFGETVEEALLAASSMTNEELYARAQEEIAAGAQLNFYATTSFAEKAAANFMTDYPALDGKVVYAEIDDGETYTILTAQIGSGVAESADMALTQNGPDLKTYLLDENLAYNYFPASMKDIVDEGSQVPTVITYINSLFIYHNGEGSIQFNNVWELTEDAWKDRIFFKDPTKETVNLNFLMMLNREDWQQRMAAAYEDRYQKAWEANGNFTNASQQWIDAFLKNVNYTYTSASKMATGIASGTPGNMGLFVFSKLRKVDEADRGNLSVVQFENEVDGFSGFMYPVYATVCKDTECPYTCALFINYLLSEQGFAGPKSWNSSQGYYSPNKNIQKPEDIQDQAYEYWSTRLVIEDLQFIYDNYVDLYEFIATRVG